MTENNTARFDADIDLDDIDDLPSFAVFHSGAVLVEVLKQERKEVGSHDAWTFTAKLLQWVEPTEEPLPGEKLAAPGDVCDVLWMLDNEVGLGKMKEALKGIKAHLNVTKTSEVWAGMTGMQLLMIGKRVPKKDKDGFNYNVVQLAVP